MDKRTQKASASGDFIARPPPGLCSWTPLGDFCPPDPLTSRPLTWNPEYGLQFNDGSCCSIQKTTIETCGFIV